MTEERAKEYEKVISEYYYKANQLEDWLTEECKERNLNKYKVRAIMRAEKKQKNDKQD